MTSVSDRKVLTALAVDDDDMVLSVMVQSLEELGFHTLSALGGRQAMVMLESRDDIDLLVTDVRMPRVTGLDLASAVLEKKRNLPVIFVTGYSAHFVAEGGHTPERMALLRKPYTLSELRQTVQSLLPEHVC